MKKLSALLVIILLSTPGLIAQTVVGARRESADTLGTGGAISRDEKVVVITGARFTYTLIQRLIDEYNTVNPDVQIIIESRGSHDPATYDILAEVYDRDDLEPARREYAYVARYVVLPVANSASEFASIYGKIGLTTKLIKQIYFFDPLADRDDEKRIKAPFTVYTRMQKAGVPIQFARQFGFAQSDINAKTIAGSDEHLFKVLKRDSTAVSYLPLPLIYDLNQRKPVGITVLPVDLDNNDRVTDDEKFYSNLDEVFEKLSKINPAEARNLAFGDVHLSLDRRNANPDALAFLKWVKANAAQYLNEYGFLPADANSSGTTASKGSSSSR